MNLPHTQPMVLTEDVSSDISRAVRMTTLLPHKDPDTALSELDNYQCCVQKVYV